MLIMLKSEYDNLVDTIHSHPYAFPPLSFQSELDIHPVRYLGWAIWLAHTLPQPQTDFEEKSLKMVKDYLNKNLCVVEKFDETMGDAVIW